MAVPVLLLCNILVFIAAIIALIYMASLIKHQSYPWLVLLTVSFCVVSFCTLGVYIARDFEVQVMFSRMRFLTLGFLAPGWLMFLSSIYQRPKWLQKSLLAYGLFIPGLITAIMTLHPIWRELIVTDFTPVEIGHFTVLKYSPGIWFKFHYISAMTFVVLSLILGIYISFREIGDRRLQVLLLSFCTILAASVDIYCVLTNSPYRWLMLASGTFFISLLGIIYSMAKLNLLNITSLALNKVFQEFPDPVLVIDTENKTRMANQACESFPLIKKMIGKEINMDLKLALKEGEVTLLDSRGEKHFFHLSLEKLVADSDTISGHVVFFRRITLQKNIERRLNENLEFKTRLLTLIAHDLSGQIEAQALISSSLLGEVREDSLRERIDLLATSTSFSQEFIENIFSWVKSQKSEFEPIRKDFEWNTLIRECIEEVNPLCKLKKIKVNFSTNTTVLISQGDSSMLESVVRNLLTNAIRATNNGEDIQVKLLLNGHKITVEIIDSGVGMNKESLDRVRGLSLQVPFDSSSAFNGFGVGLMIVKRFLELHQAQFFIDSQLNSGTRVAFELSAGSSNS